MQRLNKEIDKFLDLLKYTDFDKLEISQYSKDYIRKNHISLKYSTELAFQLLSIGIEKANKPINEIIVAEIGGGTGFISLIATYLGFGKVIYSDIYSQSCQDFKIISEELGLPVSKIILGSIDELSNETSGKIDLIISRDVVEHIYDTKAFFNKSSQLFKNSVHVHNTSANIYNIFKSNYFKKIHNTDEFVGYKNHIKPSDSVLPFFELRYNFIKENYPEIDENTLKKLTELTRGKIYVDIKIDVENFLITKTLPSVSSNKTNTCDPANGNRSENLLYFEEYEKMIIQSFFDIKWDYALYDINEKNLLKKIFKIILNFLIKTSGTQSKYIAPAIIMVCSPKK